MGSVVQGLFGSDNGSASVSTNWSPQAAEFYEYAKQYAQPATALSSNLLNQAANLSNNNYGLQSVDYGSMVANGQNQVANAQNTYASLLGGNMPAAYQQGMSDSIRSGVNSTVGNVVNSLGNRGVINSSVANKALSDVSSNASDAMARQYSSNLGTLGTIANGSISAAAAPISLASTGQNAAYGALGNALNASTSLQNAAVTSPLGALLGTNGKTQQNNSGDGFSNMLGTAVKLGMMFG